MIDCTSPGPAPTARRAAAVWRRNRPLGLARLLAFALLCALGGHSGAAQANTLPMGAPCVATDDGTGAAPRASDALAKAHAGDGWNCTAGNATIAGPHTLMRFDLPAGGASAPVVFSTRLTRFDRMDMTVVAADGRSATRRLGESDMRAGTDGWTMSVALPRLAPRPSGQDVSASADSIRQVYIRVEGARHPRLIADARLLDANAATRSDLRFQLVIAALIGALTLPIVFNLAFYRVLRSRFLLWHVAMVGAMLDQTLVTSGLINVFAQPSIAALSMASAVSFGAGIMAAALFLRDVLEEGMLQPRERRLLGATLWWIPGWVAFYLWAGGPLRPWVWLAYYLQFVPVLALFGWVMRQAMHRGSRTVTFQIAAWAPFMALGVFRIASALGLTNTPVEAELAQHVAIAWEVVFTTIGVSDRFLQLRRERDRAQDEARAMSSLAARDPLTGLLNRRAIEGEFTALLAEGFNAMAVLDIDHFKRVNDTRGHAAGDAVLTAIAQVLAPDRDTVAARIGGEEFLILLRGPDAARRAERRRQAIPSRVAATVPALDRLVTASMGLLTDISPAHSFATHFRQADRLLYQAKNEGRNRTISDGPAPLPGAARGARRRPATDAADTSAHEADARDAEVHHNPADGAATSPAASGSYPSESAA